MQTGKKSRMNPKLGQICLLTSELLAFKRWKIYNGENGVSSLNSGQLIFKYIFSQLFQSKRLLKYDTYMES